MSVRHASQQANPFVTAPIGRLLLSNAFPMAVVMSMGGVLNVVDGVFVGRFIGSDALAAVSLAFPFAMVLSALTVLVGGGMSSLMARRLGAGDRVAAEGIFASAHGLALAIAFALAVSWAVVGTALLNAMAVGNLTVAEMARDYLRIIVFGAPLQLILGIHADALRNEGRASLVAVLSVLVNLFNIGANWTGIVVLDLGISGSALGTVAAQAFGLALVVAVRAHSRDLLPLSALRARDLVRGWSRIVSLGLPLCLGLVGIAIVSSAVMLSLRLHAGAGHATAVGAYGVVTRLLTFAYLPQMAIALALQSMTGNNAGAGLEDRVREGLRLAVAAAFLWCLTVASTFGLAGNTVGAWFSNDPAVVTSVTQMLRPMMLLYVFSGPILVLAIHFQALGQPGRTAALTLLKPWLLLPALILALPAGFGVPGIWLAFPIADALNLILATTIAYRLVRSPEQTTCGAELRT